jgi:acyl carrier protein
MLTKQSLMQFMEQGLGIEMADIDEETPLFSSGIIDSARMVDLIVYIESEAGVTFQPDDISLDYLDSVSRILAFLAAKREA